jgi:hypothetical protein
MSQGDPARRREAVDAPSSQTSRAARPDADGGRGLRDRPPARAETVTLKNGIVYSGTIDRDNTILSVYDGLRRVVLRDSKVATIEPGGGHGADERFHVDQPLEVHAGAMPAAAVGVRASAWDESGRRSFSYVGARVRTPARMTQAINELGPRIVRYRGIDGFWLGQVATDQVPRSVVLGLLRRVDPRTRMRGCGSRGS